MLIRQEGRALTVETPAKLNLFLEVLGKRADGYHELETLMVMVGLYDTLTFTEESSGELCLSCLDAGRGHRGGSAPPEAIPAGRDNLVVQAAELLQREAGTTGGARIVLQKRIPAAAGLAGGSSDAAATLAALNRLWTLGLSSAELQELASRLGSDIAFFLQPSAAAVCRGRGEIIEPLAFSTPLHFVIVRPHTGLSTAQVFGHCRPATTARRVGSLAAALQQGHLAAAARRLFNSLQEPAEQLNSEVRELQQVLSEEPVLGHAMSGSGTACFGMCSSRRQALRIAARLHARRIGRVFVTDCRP